MLIFWGTTNDYVVLTFVTAGMTAGSLATFSPYMPAYFAYAVPFTGTMALASFFSHDDVIPGNAPLILFYFAVITLTCRHFNRFVSHTVELKVDNEILKESLTTTRQERDRARTEKWSTLAQLSHELRTPLNAIMGFSEAMRDEVLGALGNRRYKDYAGHIHTSGHHLLTVADELLLLSQGESGMLVLKETPVDFGGLIASLVTQRREMALNTGLQLTVRIAPDLPRLKADSVMLHHMLGNLLDNAFKFTPAGGAVQLTAAVNDDGCLAVSIEDSGIGMEAADIPRALRPFGRISSPLTANTCGAGLGLPICQRLADAHGANLAIASTPGTGTRVTVTFPAERVLAAENPAESDTCKGEAAA
jgi:Signal transduction histidine kinase